jgi:hypothetical protein
MKEIRTIEKRFYRTFCDYVMEMLKMMSMDKEEVKKHLTRALLVVNCKMFQHAAPPPKC